MKHNDNQSLFTTSQTKKKYMVSTRRLSINYLVISLCVLNFLLTFFCYIRVEPYGEDSSYYIGLAESIVQEGTYEFNTVPHTKYPPGVPLLLSTASLISASPSYSTYVRIMGLMGILAVVACYWYILRYSQTLAVAAVLLTLSSPWYFALSTAMVLSDLPYFLSSMIVLVSVSALNQDNGRWPVCLNVILCCALIGSVLFRSVAIALLSGLFLFICSGLFNSKTVFIERVKKFLPALMVGVLTFLFWVIWSHYNRQPAYDFQYMDSYFVQFFMKDPHIPDLGAASLKDILFRIGQNIPRTSADFAQLLLNFPYVAAISYSPLVVLPVLFIINGLFVSVRKHAGDIGSWYLISYLGIFLLWPFDEGPRFFLPVFPLAVLFLWIGVESLYTGYTRNRDIFCRNFMLFFMGLFILSIIMAVFGELKGGQSLYSIVFWGAGSIFFLARYSTEFSDGFIERLKSRGIFRIGSISVLALVIMAGYTQQVRLVQRMISPDPEKYPHHNNVLAGQWIDKNLQNDTVVMAGQHAIVHRISKNRIIPFPVTGDAEKIVGVMKSHNVEYLVVAAADDNPYFLPTEEERLNTITLLNNELLTLQFQGLNFRVYSVSFR